MPTRRALGVLPALLASLAAAAYPAQYSASLLSPALWPGNSSNGEATFLGAQPLGNGDVAALVWADVVEGRVELYVRKADAQGSSGDELVITYASLLLAPNPFINTSGGVAPFNQTLELDTATVVLTAGGGGRPGDALVRVTARVHAAANVVLVEVEAGPGAPPLAATLTLRSVRPAARATYPISWACWEGSAEPDVFVDPLPPGFAVASVAQFHRNAPTDNDMRAELIAQQSLSAVADAALDIWRNRTFGVAASACGAGGAALVRVNATTLATAAPAASLCLRIDVASGQFDDEAAFLAELAALAAAPLPAPAAHDEWWATFWNRSFVEVTVPSSPPVTRGSGSGRGKDGGGGGGNNNGRGGGGGGELRPAALASPPSLVLRLAADFPGLTPGPLAVWPNAAIPGSYDAAQASASARPVFAPRGRRGLPAVVFNASRGSFLGNGDLALPAAGATVLAVFTDAGSPSTCCSGIFFALGSCRGLSTSAGAGGRVSVEADWCYGTDPHGAIDVRGRAVVAAVVYEPSATLPRNSSAASFVGGCPQTRDAAIPVAASLGFMVGSRNDELGRFFEGELHELRVYNASLSASELEAETEALRARWQVPPLAPDDCPAPPDVGFAISQKFAMLRYLSAAQSRGNFSIVFNGQLFVANRPPRADARVWGTLDCHQNSRLAYVPLLATGDGDLHRAWLEHNLARMPLWRARTQHFFGHDGIHMTECKSPLGTPSSKHYDGSCAGSPSSRPAGYPVNEPCYSSGNAFEYGGDGGTPEVGLAALEHYYYTQDAAALARFLPLATLAATFYAEHYSTDASGRLYIYPTGVTEYNWCAWNTTSHAPSDDCCANDLPTVAGVAQLLEQLLTALPANASTAEQRAAWAAALAALPPLPTAPLPGSGTTALAHAQRMCSSGTNNVETPELYAVHPYRRLTVGRALGDRGPGAGGVTSFLAPAVASYYADPNTLTNHDWTQSVFDAALLGLASDAARLVAERALAPPAPGYSWPGFAPAVYDYAPVSELYAGMVSAVSWMLLQPGDDARGSMALLPAWPCEWSVRFRLRGPLNTTVDLDYAPGLRRELTVTPAARLRDVAWAGCGP